MRNKVDKQNLSSDNHASGCNWNGLDVKPSLRDVDRTSPYIPFCCL